MSLTGIEVACGYASALALVGLQVRAIGPGGWTETLDAPGTTAQSAPHSGAVVVVERARGPSAERQPQSSDDRPIFRVLPAVDAWCAVGPYPDASQGPRTKCKAGETIDIPASGGNRLAWIPA